MKIRGFVQGRIFSCATRLEKVAIAQIVAQFLVSRKLPYIA
ncbi:MAG: hypothetical protein V7K67_27350 [Nostoc sp.]